MLKTWPRVLFSNTKDKWLRAWLRRRNRHGIWRHLLVELGRINLKASKRKLVAQALTHSMRHWAQISTFLRQQGLKQEWNHDFLLTKAMQ